MSRPTLQGWRRAVRMGWMLGIIGIPSLSGLSSAETENYQFKWLDPDKKVYVLQNRIYTKKNNTLISVMGGVGLTGAYNSTLTAQPRVSYFFTEEWGVEGFYSYYSNERNDTFRALEDSTIAIPTIREVSDAIGIKLVWVPWYAKINVFNAILYFDWYFAGGIGRIHTRLDQNTVRKGTPNYKDENALSFHASTGHIYHLSDLIFARLDFSGAYFQAPNQKGVDQWNSDYTFVLGLGLKL